MARMLVLDNHDSFTYNLVQLFLGLGVEITVRRSDAVDLDGIRELSPDYLLVGPGPGDPGHAGVSVRAIRRFAGRLPILGICLGMQCINEALGGHTVRAAVPMHGKTSLVHHHGQGLFEGLPSPFQAARYHSLAVRISSPDLVETAVSDDGVVMGLSHRELPLHGVQFHPESFLTRHGRQLAANFLRLGSWGGHEARP